MTPDKKSEIKVETFLRVADKYYGDWKFLIARSLVAGLFTGIGATLGLGLVLWIVTQILNYLGILPVVGEFFSRLNSLLGAYRVIG